MSVKEIIGPYFIELERGRAVTVNVERYVEMLENFLVPEFKSFLAISTMVLVNGETSHTSNTYLRCSLAN